MGSLKNKFLTVAQDMRTGFQQNPFAVGLSGTGAVGFTTIAVANGSLGMGFLSLFLSAVLVKRCYQDGVAARFHNDGRTQRQSDQKPPQP
jgi:hypothetical protein